MGTCRKRSPNTVELSPVASGNSHELVVSHFGTVKLCVK